MFLHLKTPATWLRRILVATLTTLEPDCLGINFAIDYLHYLGEIHLPGFIYNMSDIIVPASRTNEIVHGAGLAQTLIFW